MTQIDAIFIFCDGESRHKEWVKTWSKVKGIYAQIEPIRKVLGLGAKKDNQDCITMECAPMRAGEVTENNLNQLESSFIYNQLFKNALLDIKHNREKPVQSLVRHCEKVYYGNSDQLRLIEKFGRNYH